MLYILSGVKLEEVYETLMWLVLFNLSKPNESLMGFLTKKENFLSHSFLEKLSSLLFMIQTAVVALLANTLGH